jgi:hypothetical protein
MQNFELFLWTFVMNKSFQDTNIKSSTTSLATSVFYLELLMGREGLRNQSQ